MCLLSLILITILVMTRVFSWNNFMGTSLWSLYLFFSRKLGKVHPCIAYSQRVLFSVIFQDIKVPQEGASWCLLQCWRYSTIQIIMPHNLAFLIALANLPPSIRMNRDNLRTFALWVGSKPPMNLLLKPLGQITKRISSSGAYNPSWNENCCWKRCIWPRGKSACVEQHQFNHSVSRLCVGIVWTSNIF